MNGTGSASQDRTAHAEFPSTQWSTILNAGHRGSPAALEDLCRAYWLPLYAFLRRQGHSPHDAEDLVQGFLARVLAREDLAEVGPEKGRFRTFLLASLRNFVIKRALREKAVRQRSFSLQSGIRMTTLAALRLCVRFLSSCPSCSSW